MSPALLDQALRADNCYNNYPRRPRRCNRQNPPDEPSIRARAPRKFARHAAGGYVYEQTFEQTFLRDWDWNRPVGVVYFKRFRMEYDLAGPLFPEPQPPAGYSLLPWDDRLLEAHAEVKFRCFKWEMDANVFPCLGDREGCRRLMTEIVRRSGFIGQATWLLQHRADHQRRPETCGTIQGVSDEGLGAIQNVGITPDHRGRGLGSILLWHSLAGFQRAGIDRVYLEVSADNSGACRLYERLGFQRTKVVYKASEVAFAEC